MCVCLCVYGSIPRLKSVLKLALKVILALPYQRHVIHHRSGVAAPHRSRKNRAWLQVAKKASGVSQDLCMSIRDAFQKVDLGRALQEVAIVCAMDRIGRPSKELVVLDEVCKTRARAIGVRKAAKS